MKDLNLIPRINDLENAVDALRKELERAHKSIHELTARSDVLYRTNVALLHRHMDRAAIAKELRTHAHEQSNSDKTHYKTAMLLTVYAMLDAAGEPPRL